MNESISEEAYAAFVDGRTSGPGKHLEHFFYRMGELEHALDSQAVRLLMAAIGLASEAGECLDFVKKIVFHGKEWSEENRMKLIGELSDVQWYATNMCIALGVTREEVLAENVRKLTARYPEGFLPDGQEYREKAENSQE